MSNIRFRSAAHRDFFLEMMNKSKVNDCYHRAFFYVMGIAAETRANINQMFDFKTDCIEPEGMHGGWQTSGTVKVCHLAFNLWNGYTEKENGRYFTPDELFCCEYAPYFVEGIMDRIIKRGDIYYANLNPVIGSEQGGTRPVLILSNDTGNKHSPTVIVAAITGQIGTKKKLPTHTIVHNVNGLDKDSIILLEQIRTIDKQRLQEYLGTLDGRFLVAVDKALAISVALERGGKSA